MKKGHVAAGVAALVAVTAAAQVKETERLEDCTKVLHELAGTSEGIPHDLLEKGRCVAVIPGVKKAAFGIGGRWGKGAVVCRAEGGRGPWGAPLMVSVGGPSYGFQIGAESTDFVLLVMNERGIDHLLKNKVTLGADVSVAAGPVGRTAEAGTDVALNAEILTYSRTKGLFAGVSLEGAILKPDDDANRHVYGHEVSSRDVLVRGTVRVPSAGRPLVAALSSLSPGPVPAE